MLTRGSFLAAVEHTLLDPTADRRAVESFLEDALAMGVGGVCVSPCWVFTARLLLRGCAARLVTVAGFPHGTSLAAVKAHEAAAAVAAGASEVDMVVSIGAVRSGLGAAVRREIEDVVAAASGAAVKVIVEAAALTDAEKRLAASLARDGGARFVKTSTGYGKGGATPKDVRLLAEASGLPVKAAGGIRTLSQADALVDAGAVRLGMSRTAAVLAELEAAGR